jgi:hypothetical protein
MDLDGPTGPRPEPTWPSLYFALLVRRRLAFPCGERALGAGRWRWRWRLGGSHWELSHSIDWIQDTDTGPKKQQHKAEPLVGEPKNGFFNLFINFSGPFVELRSARPGLPAGGCNAAARAAR